jgi:hypothetical protein
MSRFHQLDDGNSRPSGSFSRTSEVGGGGGGGGGGGAGVFGGSVLGGSVFGGSVFGGSVFGGSVVGGPGLAGGAGVGLGVGSAAGGAGDGAEVDVLSEGAVGPGGGTSSSRQPPAIAIDSRRSVSTHDCFATSACLRGKSRATQPASQAARVCTVRVQGAGRSARTRNAGDRIGLVRFLNTERSCEIPRIASYWRSSLPRR